MYIVEPLIMKIYETFIVILLPILLFGCSEELIIGNDIPESTDQIQSRSSGDGKYDVLGYGYDVTYEYFNASPQSMKAQVIDVDAYVKMVKHGIII